MTEVLRISTQPMSSFESPTQIGLPNVAGLSFQPSKTDRTTSTSPPFRGGHLNLDTFSPVNHDGTFEFDRVLKRGNVQKRVEKNRAWKTTWKPVRLVLRPNLMSIYKDEEEAGLRASISLSDVTAVVALKNSKSKRNHVFCVYTPSRNFYFQALSASDAADWVERIRSEARVDALEEQLLSSPLEPKNGRDSLSDQEEDRCSSPELGSAGLSGQRNRRGTHTSTTTGTTRPRQVSQSHDFSGPEMTSYSDFSDSFDPHHHGSISKSGRTLTRPPAGPRNASQQSVIELSADAERVVFHGYLYILKTKSGVRQWKKLWVVLRPRNLSFYKNEQEYSAVLILPMSSVVNAAEIDPVSKSKKDCLQIIAEEKTYRFCAPDEESVIKWVGSLKSVIAKRNETMKKVPVV